MEFGNGLKDGWECLQNKPVFHNRNTESSGESGKNRQKTSAKRNGEDG